MKLLFIDSNIFLEVLARNGEKSDRCRKLLESGKDFWTTELVLAEVEWVLRAGYAIPREKIVQCLKRILSLRTLDIKEKAECIEALGLYENGNIDWIDCMNAVIAKKQGVSQVISFDKHFNRFDWLERVEP